MARDHCRISLDIWDDDEWLALTSVQQLTYLSLISSPDLSWCGVLPYTPGRYARLSGDGNARRTSRAMADLEDGRFLVIDHDTAEVLVRSYVRHDGLLKQPNVTKALVSAYARVHSDVLRAAIRVELRRLYAEDPSRKGWQGMRTADPELFREVST